MKHIKINSVIYHHLERSNQYVSNDGEILTGPKLTRALANGEVKEAERVKVFAFPEGNVRYALRHDLLVVVQEDKLMFESALSAFEFIEKLANEDFTVEEIYL